jgi:FMN-dependent NADH-azoreductase
VAEVFLESYRSTHPDAVVDIMDLWNEPLPPYARNGAGAKMTVFSGGEPADAEAEAWSKVRAVFERFNSAEHYLFAVPMWNSSIPYVLKHLIDIITQPGLTFSFDPETGYAPLLENKKAAVVYTAGVHPQNRPGFGSDFQIPFFTDWLHSIGITDVSNIEFRPTILTADPDAAREKAHARARNIAKIF